MLSILGICFFIYVYYSLFYTSIQKRIYNSKESISEYVQKINDTRAAEELYIKQTGELESIRIKYEEAKVVLPQMEMNPEIIYNIKKFFLGSGVDARNISVGKAEELPNPGSQIVNIDQYSLGNKQSKPERTVKLVAVPVSIALSADSYEEVMKFICLFEKDKRFAEITAIEITAKRPALKAENKNPVKIDSEQKEEVEKRIEIVAVGEGEGYKEIPLYEEEESREGLDESQETSIDESDTATVDSDFKIDVNMTARYYYIDTNTNEQPIYSFKNAVHKKKDLFK